MKYLEEHSEEIEEQEKWAKEEAYDWMNEEKH